VFDRITALMSLLEGHADHVMDDVGPDIVPTVSVIRERFDRRRNEPGAADGLARRLLGLDAKMRQYSDGRAFVSGVVDLVGRDGFNRVWDKAEHLPTRDEILDSPAWCRRVAADLLPT
jgi:putative hydrolase